MDGEPMEDRKVNGEVSPPSPNLCHSLRWSNAQWLSLRRSRLSPSFSPLSSQDSAAEDVIYAHLNHGTLSKRRITPTPMSPMHAFTKPRIYEDFNVNQDCAEPWPGPMLWTHRVLQIEDLDFFLKEFLHGNSFSSSKAAQQLWDKQWSPRIIGSSSKILPPLSNLLAILGLYFIYLMIWGEVIINHKYCVGDYDHPTFSKIPIKHKKFASWFIKLFSLKK